MSGRKHGAIHLSKYAEIHNTIMDRFLRGGFVLTEDLEFYAVEGSVLIEGIIKCLDGLEIQVKKRLQVLSPPDATDPLVQTVFYIYNLHVPGRGPVFRYNSPHPDHNFNHHCHRYDIFEGDSAGVREDDFSDDDWPTLGEVMEESEMWYYANAARMREMGFV